MRPCRRAEGEIGRALNQGIGKQSFGLSLVEAFLIVALRPRVPDAARFGN
jgi:hypothetical protein